MSKFVILHKERHLEFGLCCIMKVSAKPNIYSIHERRCLLQILYIIQHSYTTSLKIKFMQIVF